MLTILEGSTFCICDELGDVGDDTSGFFADDTRFLSRLWLTVNGARPLPLSSGKVEYFSAAFFLRNPLAGDLLQDQLSITRERFVGEGMQDVVNVENHSMDDVAFELGLEFAADFADIFSVKEHDFALGDPMRAEPLPRPSPALFEPEHNQFVLEDPRDALRTQVLLSQRGRRRRLDRRLPVELEPARAVGGAGGRRTRRRTARRSCRKTVERRFGDERARVRDSLAAWQLRVPQLARRLGGARASRSASRSPISRRCGCAAPTRRRSCKLPAAGMPWFMTVFGRDTLITCLQTLLFGPELARNALEALAALQATEDDPSIDAEPGKIVHEVRHGQGGARTGSRATTARVDATPLYLILFSEVWRWTGDATIAEDFKEPALRALEWIDKYGDRDGDGFVEFEKRAPHGLDVQSWKDSGDSQRFHDGRIAHGADRAVRGAGLRLRRQAAARRDRARSVARPRARGAADA